METVINPMVIKWIDQLDDWDPSSAYYAYQCLEREALHSSKPGNGAACEALAKALADALIGKEEAKTAEGDEAGKYLHTTRARNQLARLLGYIPTGEVLPQLAQAIKDYDVREMVRYALDSNGSDGATKILIGALDAPGPVFRVGVVNSLARREGKMAAAALKKAAGDAQADVRIAAFKGLAARPEPGHDSIIEKGTRGDSDGERRGASIARARLSETLRARGKPKAARQVAESILDSTAPEAQKKAARLTLERLAAS